MKLEKFNKILIVFIVVISIALAIAIPLSIIEYQKEEETPLKDYECIKYGKYCTEEEIYNGVEVEVAVNDNEKQRFYVIDNDEYSMTLIMKQNVAKQIDWHDGIINIYGPDIAHITLNEKTKSWKNIDLIDSYTYQDGGRLTFETNCQNNTTEKNYDCSTTSNPTRGYIGFRIENGELYQTANLFDNPLEDNFVSGMRARLVTAEEIENLIYKKKLPKWLISNLDEKEGYWTSTSSTAIKTGYSQGAIAIANNDGQASIESLFVQKAYEPKYKIGIRPVIRVLKEKPEDMANIH